MSRPSLQQRAAAESWFTLLLPPLRPAADTAATTMSAGSVPCSSSGAAA